MMRQERKSTETGTKEGNKGERKKVWIGENKQMSIDRNHDDVEMTLLPSKAGRNEHESRTILSM